MSYTVLFLGFVFGLLCKQEISFAQAIEVRMQQEFVNPLVQQGIGQKLESAESNKCEVFKASCKEIGVCNEKPHTESFSACMTCLIETLGGDTYAARESAQEAIRKLLETKPSYVCAFPHLELAYTTGGENLERHRRVVELVRAAFLDPFAVAEAVLIRAIGSEAQLLAAHSLSVSLADRLRTAIRDSVEIMNPAMALCSGLHFESTFEIEDVPVTPFYTGDLEQDIRQGLLSVFERVGAPALKPSVCEITFHGCAWDFSCEVRDPTGRFMVQSWGFFYEEPRADTLHNHESRTSVRLIEAAGVGDSFSDLRLRDVMPSIAIVRYGLDSEQTLSRPNIAATLYGEARVFQDRTSPFEFTHRIGKLQLDSDGTFINFRDFLTNILTPAINDRELHEVLFRTIWDDGNNWLEVVCKKEDGVYIINSDEGPLVCPQN